ncbi:pilus assembly protein TadG-related protein [Streptomyces polygonati]|uniref:Pilus assembly protein TadG-related protein n=1 Tax=Streptomyces polygonati TaxID=1617087 RepID=A0ABV8HNG0_9ACTN
MRRTPRGEAGQTFGIYIVAMAALFFLAFAYFAVGQAAVIRNRTQTAADAAALAAARELRDGAHDAFLADLLSGDTAALGQLLTNLPLEENACAAAQEYAGDNGADVTPGGCTPVNDPPGFHVEVRSRGTVGPSVVKGTENIHASAHATAVVVPRCTLAPAIKPVVDFTCDNGPLEIDPTQTGFVLDLSDFFTVHLSD